MTADEAATLATRVEGWLSDEQGRALHAAAAAATGRGAIVEIGSWKGRSTIWLAAGAQLAGQRVHAVDPHVDSKEDPQANTLAEFQRNLAVAGLSTTVVPLVMSSADAAAVLTAPVELLFIDGDHAYDAVKRDVELWLPRLIEGGTVMFHDVTTTAYSGPRRVFRRDVCLRGGFDSIARVGSMTVARRTARRGLRAALWGPAAALLLYLYDAKTLIRSWTR